MRASLLETSLQTATNFLLQLHPLLLMAGGMILGTLLVFLFLLPRHRRLRAEAFEAGLQQTAAQQAEERAVADIRSNRANEQQAADAARISTLREQLDNTQQQLERKREQLSEALSQSAATSARLEETQKSFAQREKSFSETSDALKKEFELLANRVFEQQGEKHQASLHNVLSPFREQIVDFRKRVEEVYHSDTKERASLLTEVKSLQRASEKINQEAENLTKALKGDKKLQGNWGEMVLERVLEESGLRKDHEYFLQTSQRNLAGDLKRPDVLIRLPDNKDVVIDSKVSLNAYEEALASEADDRRDQLMRTHLTNLRNHVKRLSEQDYDQLPNVRSLDFVLLFVPIESAFTMAMEADPRLFTDAFAHRIVLVSPTTLMMTLRIINNVWRYEKQNRNAQEIAQRAGALYDKLRLLVDEMETLGKQLGTAERTYKSVFARLATGKGNLIRQVEQFRELGAQVKKPMPDKLLDKASEND